MNQAVTQVAAAPPAPKGFGAALGEIVRVILSDRRSTIGVAILLVSVVVALIGPYVTPYDPDEPNTAIRLTGPSWEHWMGTDHIGRDLFSRVLAGLTVSMMVALGAVAIAVLAGLPLGALSGYMGHSVDVVVMRLMDTIIAFPGRLLAIALVAAMGASVVNLWFAIAFSSIPRYARITRGGVLAQKEREYVEAARAIGESPSAVLIRYILPNSLAPVAVQISLNFAFAILAESSLSFLGLGLVPPTISWGQMLSAAQEFMEIAPWLAIFPGLALSILILGFVLLGDALRDHLDPRQGRRGRR